MHISDLFYTASRLTKIKLTPEEASKIKSFIGQLEGKVEEQLHFFKYCKQHKIAPWIFLQLKKHGYHQHFDPEVFNSFEKEYDTVKNQNERRTQVALQFLAEFNAQNIDVAILKGNLFAGNIYNDIGYKRMNDFDILIKSSDWVKAQHVYEALHYLPLGFGWAGEKQEPAKFSHVGIPFVSPEFQCIVGTQWGLKSPTTKYKVPISTIWNNMQSLQYDKVSVKQMSPINNLLHLILHMGIYKCSIRDCMDVYNVMLANNIDNKELIALLKATNAIDKAYFTLTMANICSDAIDNDLLSELRTLAKKSFAVRRLKSRLQLFENGADFHDSYNDYFQDVEKCVIYFSLFQKFHQKLPHYVNVLGKVLWPNATIALKLSDKSGRNVTFFERSVARLKAPYYIFSMIAEEIGWRYTLLIFFKLLFDLLVSIKNYLFKTESYFDFLKRRGVVPKQIKTLVANVQ